MIVQVCPLIHLQDQPVLDALSAILSLLVHELMDSEVLFVSSFTIHY